MGDEIYEVPWPDAVRCDDRVNTRTGASAMGAPIESIASALSRLTADEAGADGFAALAAEKMHAIHLALAPIIGERGVSALYRRSLFLIGQDTPWINELYGQADAGTDYAILQSALARQPAAEALRITERLFTTLYSVLVSLIGTALAERLLHPMFEISPNGHAVQEIPHE